MATKTEPKTVGNGHAPLPKAGPARRPKLKPRVDVPEKIQLEVIMLLTHELEPNPLNPRFNFDEVGDIIESIREVGVQEPILVYPSPIHDPKDRIYRIAEGHRRWYASTQVGREQIPCIVDKSMTDSDAAERALMWNSARRNLTPLEEATQLKRVQEFRKCTPADLVKLFPHFGTSGVHYRLKLLEWPKSIQNNTHRGMYSISTITALERLAQKCAKSYDEYTLGQVRKALSAQMRKRHIHRTTQIQQIIDAEWNEAFTTALLRFLNDETITLSEIQIRGAGDPSKVIQQMHQTARLLHRLGPFLPDLSTEKKAGLLSSLSEMIDVSAEVFENLTTATMKRRKSVRKAPASRTT